MPAAELPVLVVPAVSAWAQWLVREAEISTGVWLTLAKKGITHPTSLTYAQALDEALCHGWIDGQAKSCDVKTFYHRFTPRTKTSSWSKRNVGIVERLEKEGRMMSRGLKEVEKAKGDGRWEAAYAGQATMEPSAELSAAIASDADAAEMWETLTKQNRYAFCHRLASLRTEAGRQKRITATVEMLRRGETPHPQKSSRMLIPKKGKPSPQLETPSKIEKPVRRSTRVRK